MKERPIIFSGPMVRAILDGRKTQTRRIVKPQPPEWITKFGYTCFTPPGHISGRGYWKGVPGDEGPGEKFFRSPYGKPGDRLLVREAWKYANWTEDGEPYIEYRADGACLLRRDSPEEWGERLMDIWATLSDSENYSIDQRAADRRWRPSIHMPRWASRIMLEVTGVRVERLQEISNDDAKAEGITFIGVDELNHITAFRKLWDSINAKRAPWESNPWVWVVEFRRLTY